MKERVAGDRGSRTTQKVKIIRTDDGRVPYPPRVLERPARGRGRRCKMAIPVEADNPHCIVALVRVAPRSASLSITLNAIALCQLPLFPCLPSRRGECLIGSQTKFFGEHLSAYNRRSGQRNCGHKDKCGTLSIRGKETAQLHGQM